MKPMTDKQLLVFLKFWQSLPVDSSVESIYHTECCGLCEVLFKWHYINFGDKGLSIQNMSQFLGFSALVPFPDWTDDRCMGTMRMNPARRAWVVNKIKEIEDAEDQEPAKQGRPDFPATC